MIRPLRLRHALDFWPYFLLTVSVVGLAYKLWEALH
jgi:hypothetical protein